MGDRSPFCYNSSMISEYFYMPRTNKKVTEEDRIKFTQDRIKSVREFLTRVVFQQVFIPEIAPNEHNAFFDQFDRTPRPWNAAWTPNRMVINYNWWYKNVDEFCTERRVKIPDIDFFYILMQMCRERGLRVRPVDGTLSLSLNKPNYLFGN